MKREIPCRLKGTTPSAWSWRKTSSLVGIFITCRASLRRPLNGCPSKVWRHIFSISPRLQFHRNGLPSRTAKGLCGTFSTTLGAPNCRLFHQRSVTVNKLDSHLNDSLGIPVGKFLKLCPEACVSGIGQISRLLGQQTPVKQIFNFYHNVYN